jgi:hypothetical protein
MNRIPGEKYVLERFTQEELEKLEDCFPQIENEVVNDLND